MVCGIEMRTLVCDGLHGHMCGMGLPLDKPFTPSLRPPPPTRHPPLCLSVANI